MGGLWRTGHRHAEVAFRCLGRRPLSHHQRSPHGAAGVAPERNTRETLVDGQGPRSAGRGVILQCLVAAARGELLTVNPPRERYSGPAGCWLFGDAVHLADLRGRAGQPALHHLEQHDWLRLVDFQEHGRVHPASGAHCPPTRPQRCKSFARRSQFGLNAPRRENEFELKRRHGVVTTIAVQVFAPLRR